MMGSALAILAVLAFSASPSSADDSLDPWAYFPETTEPPFGAYYVTGRRRRIIKDGDPAQYANYTRATVDASGVTHACLVTPFAGTVRRFLADNDARAVAAGTEEGDASFASWECRQAFGSVLANYTAVPLDGPMVARLVAHIPTEVPSLAAVLQGGGGGGGSFRVTSASKLDLRFSDDNGVTLLAVELATRQARFVAPVVLGTMFFLEIEVWGGAPGSAAAVAVVHKVGVSLTRTKALTVFSHLAEVAAGADASCAAAATAAEPGKEAEPKAEAAAAVAAEEGGDGLFTAPIDPSRTVKVMTYNVWNVNPPAWVYRNAAERWDRYSARIDHLAKVREQESAGDGGSEM